MKAPARKKPGAMPVFGDAFLKDTLHLSAEEFGAYWLLLLAAWPRDNCDLPNDDKKLARIARVSPQKWRGIKETVLEFWTPDGENIFQKRQVREREWVDQKSKVNALNREQGWKRKGYEASDAQDIENKGNGVNEPITNVIPEDNEPSTPPPPPPPHNSNILAKASICALAEESWNDYCVISGGKKIRRLSDKRKRGLIARLSEVGIDDWNKSLKIAAQSEMLGRDPPTWFDFDFLIKNDTNILKLLEGKYDKSFEKQRGSYGSNTGSATQRAMERVEGSGSSSSAPASTTGHDRIGQVSDTVRSLQHERR